MFSVLVNCSPLVLKVTLKLYVNTVVSVFAFSALTLLVGQQEGHQARKKYGGMVEVGTS